MTALKECSDSAVPVDKADLLSWNTLFESQIALCKCVKTFKETRKKEITGCGMDLQTEEMPQNWPDSLTWATSLVSPS